MHGNYLKNKEQQLYSYKVNNKQVQNCGLGYPNRTVAAGLNSAQKNKTSQGSNQGPPHLNTQIINH